MKQKPDRSLTQLEEERAVPWGDPGLFAWHRARYAFAARFVSEKRVLDLGSGEGYGAALLAEKAAEVIGIDYSEAAVRHASREYGREELSFRIGDAAALDASLGRFDIVTCFEVLEHVAQEDALLAAITRVLEPTGTLFLSTPNRLVDRLFEEVANRDSYEYHINLLTPRQLNRAVEKRFHEVTLYGQSIRGNPLHAIIKAADVFNLRHRIVRSAQLQKRIATKLMGEPIAGPMLSFRFSRLLVRQSPIVIVVASRPTVRGGVRHGPTEKSSRNPSGSGRVGQLETRVGQRNSPVREASSQLT